MSTVRLAQPSSSPLTRAPPIRKPSWWIRRAASSGRLLARSPSPIPNRPGSSKMPGRSGGLPWRPRPRCWKTCRPRQVAALAITNQRESVLAWERATGKPLGPCITWQCNRSAPFCGELRQRGLTDTIYRLTGLTIDPMFSASKARWLLENIPDGLRRAQAGDMCLGTVDAWLLWNLTGGAVHACDVTNASRTQLFNLQTLAWDDDAAGYLRDSSRGPAGSQTVQRHLRRDGEVCQAFRPACRSDL